MNVPLTKILSIYRGMCLVRHGICEQYCNVVGYLSYALNRL